MPAFAQLLRGAASRSTRPLGGLLGRHAAFAQPSVAAAASPCGCRHFRATAPSSAKDDYYEKLGISKEASASEVKKAYYQAAKKHHPDTNKGDPAAAKKFAEATEAYEVLSDTDRRKQYDAYGHAGTEQGGGGPGGGFGGPFGGPFGGGGMGGFGRGGQVDAEDLFREFENLFSGGARRQRGPPRGRDVQAQLGLDFLEAVHGCRKTVAWRSPVSGQREVEVDIPAGVDSGMNLRLNGQGEKGEGGNGNLFIAVAVRDHEHFQREGVDVHLQLRVSLAEAALGASLKVPTLDGTVTLKVPPGTQPGDRRVMQGRGIRDPNGRGRGHQFVHFDVRIPHKLSARQRELLEGLAAEENIDDADRYGGDPASGKSQRGRG